MRQIVVFLVAFFIFGASSFAQNENRARTLRDNIGKSDVAINEPRKARNIKTWMDRGKLFHDAYNVNVGFLYFGMSPADARILFRDPRQVVSSEERGTVREIYEYSNLRLVFENGALSSWEEIRPITENPLEQAINAYVHARTLDNKGKNARKINDAIRSINSDLENKFYNEYFSEKFLDAHNTALKRVEFSKLLDVVDTTFYFYSGLAAHTQSGVDGSMWQTAVDNFETALSHGYRGVGDNRGQVYNLLFTALMNMGESDKALDYAKTGFERFPNYIQLMYELINYYIAQEQNDLALNYLEQAIAGDPTNSNLLLAKGKVLDDLGEREKSIAAYDAAIALDPTYFDPYFNKSVMFYNSAIRIMEDANNARTNAEYESLRDKADDEFMRAIAPMEKAHELNPNEVSVIDTLRVLYYRLRTKNPEYEAKSEEMSKKLEALR